MKQLFILAVMALTFTACGNKSKVETTTTCDSCAVDTVTTESVEVITDSVSIDSVSIDTISE